MKLENRWYQAQAAQAGFRDILKGYNPVIAAPTGSGKTIMFVRVILKLFKKYPKIGVLIVSDTKRIVEQDYNAINNFFIKRKIGLYCSGLKSKTIKQITVGSIQSISKRPEKFTRFKLIIIDECDAVPYNIDSMYRKFIAYMPSFVRFIGFSGTIFRTGTGFIYKGKGALFNKLSYDLTEYKKYNRLVKEGYLCKMISKRPDLALSRKAKTIKHDFSKKDLAKENDRKAITKALVKETIKYKKHYKKWLGFAIDIKHAEHLNKELLKHNINSRTLHSKLKEEEQNKNILDFRKGKIKCLVSVDMITVGFDVPDIDLIIMARPTKSLRLHIQMLGRGGRPAIGKDHLLVLDFANNVKNLGPINKIEVPDPKKKKGKGEAPTKLCLDCNCEYHISVKKCDYCGAIFPIKEKIKEKPSYANVLFEKKEIWADVESIDYFIYYKYDGSPIFLVTYRLKFESFKVDEYVCLEHSGYAKHIAKNWVNWRWPDKKANKPKKVVELYEQAEFLKKPKKIKVKLPEKKKDFYKIVDFKF
jgi:DNA repair protein RadD